MDGEANWSNEFLELVERRYTLIKCFNRRFKARGIELPAGFFKEHFKDLLTLPSGAQIATLRGHTLYVSCLIVHNNILYSGSEDRTIRAWNLDTNECITALRGHTNNVRCLIVHNNILYSGSWDNTIRAWNLDTNECISALRGHTNYVICLIIHNNILYSGSVDNTIRAWQL